MRRSLSRFLPYAALLLFAFGLRYYFAFHVFPQGYFMKYPALIDEIQGASTERALDGSFGYLTFHRCCKWIFAENLRWTLLIQLVLGSFSVLVIAAIGRRLFGAASGWLSGVIAASYSTLLLYDDVFEPETLLLFLTASWMYLLVSSEGARAKLFLAGLTFGAALATRPTVLLILPFVLIFARGKRWSLTSIILPVLLVLVGLAGRNAIHNSGRIDPLTMNPGEAFYEGNNPLSRGAVSAYPLIVKEQEAQTHGRSDFAHSVYRQIARGAIGDDASATACNRYWTRLAMAYVLNEPMAWVGIELNKVRFLFSGYEAHDVEHAALAQEAAAQYPTLRFPIVAALGLVGLFLAVKYSRDPNAASAAILLLAPTLACFAVANLVFYVSARQRLHMMPSLILFAGFTLVYLVERLRAREIRVVVACLAVSGFLTLVFSQRPPEAEEMRYIRQRSLLAGRHYRAAISSADPLLRRTHAAAAVAAAPFLFDKLRPVGVDYDPGFYQLAARDTGDSSLLDTGVVSFLAGDCATTRRIMAEAVPSYRFYLAPSTPDYYIGRCLDRQGDADSALDAYRRALDAVPGCPWALSRRADLLRRMGRSAEGEADQSALFSFHDAATANMLLGMAAYDAGDWTESQRRFGEVLRILPDYLKAHVFMAAAMKRAGTGGLEKHLEAVAGLGSTLAFPEADYP